MVGCMSIRWGIKCSAKINLSTKSHFKWHREIRGKMRTSISDDRKKEPIIHDNIINVKLDIVLQWIYCFNRQKARILTQPFNYHPNRVIFPASTRSPFDETNIDHFLLRIRNLYLWSHTHWFFMFYLDMLAIGELTHKICFIPFHVIQPIDFQ